MVAPYVRSGRDSDVFPPAGGCVTAALVGSSVRLAWGTHHSTVVWVARQLAHRRPGPVPHRRGASDSDGYPNFVLEPELESILREVAAAPAATAGRTV